MANDLTDFLRDMSHGLFASDKQGGLLRPFLVNLSHDLFGKDQFLRNAWSGPEKSPDSANWADKNLLGVRNFMKLALGAGLGGDIMGSATGSNEGGAMYGALSKLPGMLGGGGQGGSAPSGSGNIFDFAQQHASSGGGQQFDPYKQVQGLDPNLYNTAQGLANKGRNGDDKLLHVSSDELDQLRSTGRLTQNPQTGLPEAFNFGDLLGGGGGGGLLGPIGNIIGGNQNRQDLTGIANTASTASNPLAAPQRQQYQDQLSTLMSPQGMNDFMISDPLVNAQRQIIGRQMGANFAHSGNLPLNAIQGSAQMANAFGNQYNQRIQNLTTLGGFNQGNPYGGMPYTAMMGPQMGANSMQQGGIGGLLGALPGLFGGGGLGSLFGGGGGGDMLPMDPNAMNITSPMD